MTQDLTLSGVHHIALLCEDIERLAHFYTTVLRLTEERRWPDATGLGLRSIWLWLGPQSRLMLERAPQLSSRPHGIQRAMQDRGWHVIAVAVGSGDRGAWITHLAACNVPIVAQTDYTLYIEDPEHNRIGLSHWPDLAQSSL